MYGIETCQICGMIFALFSLWPMFQRLDDRIKELCYKAAATPQSPELEENLQHLKAALAKHTRPMRKLAAGFPVMVRPERRCTDTPPPNTIEAESGYTDQS
jgi:hypothetical protein